MPSRIRFEGLWYDVPAVHLAEVVQAITAVQQGRGRVVSLPRSDGYVHLMVTAQSSIILETATMIEFGNGSAPE